MARGTSRRGSAHGTPSSLTSLLSPNRVYTSPSQVSSTLSLLYAMEAQREYEEREALHQSDRRKSVLVEPGRNVNRIGRPPGAIIRRATRLYVAGVASGKGIERPVQRLERLPERVAFAIPRKIAICVRRKIRKEVLHAYKLVNKGRGGSGRPRQRNEWSAVKC